MLLFETHLGYGYSSKVIEKASSQGLTLNKSQIRKVKNFIEGNVVILNILIELAQENKAVAEQATKKLETLLK